MRVAVVAVLAVFGCGRLGFDPSSRGEPGSGDPEELGPDGGGNGDANFAGPDAPLPDNCVDVLCVMLAVPGDTYKRDNNWFTPATLSDFILDRHEVTVARFRAFVDAGYGTRTRPPLANAGEHPAVEASGWKANWDLNLEPSMLAFRDQLTTTNGATFTVTAGANEQKPIVGVTWYEAFAYCIWDGGRLPTFAEHEYAAFGGQQQRRFPWGEMWNAANVATGALANVGSFPAGDARWGHADLVGNADEWALDYFNALPQPCNDCANLVAQPQGPTRVQNGGSINDSETKFAQAELLHGAAPAARIGTFGFRCAREP